MRCRDQLRGPCRFDKASQVQARHYIKSIQEFKWRGSVEPRLNVAQKGYFDVLVRGPTTREIECGPCREGVLCRDEERNHARSLFDLEETLTGNF